MREEDRHWRRWGRSVFSEERVFLMLSLALGAVSGAAVVAFRLSIERIHAFAVAHGERVWLMVCALVVAVLVIHVFPRTRGSGVNQTKAALYIYDGYIRPRTAVGKFLLCSAAVGCGFSLGPEDPALQIGATIASVTGRWLKLSRERLRLLAPIGAAAGLGAAFNAPVSAVLFVIEEVVGQWRAEVFGAIVLSATSSVMVARWAFGGEPLFRVPAIEFRGVEELAAYAALGIVGGFASVAFARLIGTLRPKAKALPPWTQYVQPLCAALILIAIAQFGFPQVMGAGYEAIDQAMHNRYTWETLGILAGLKIVATTASFVSGTPGGMFAPTLFVGAMLGACVGDIERHFLPHLTGTVATYALVGMGVLFAGFLRAPMTSVFMVLEVSGNYSVIVPVMVANTLSYLIARRLQPLPIFEVLTTQDGLELPSMEEQREQPVLRVEDAMRAAHLPVVHGTKSVREALDCAEREKAEYLLVDDRPRGWMVAAVFDLKTGIADAPVRKALGQERVPHLYPDHRLETALMYLKEGSSVPVLHRAAPHPVVGVLSLEDVMQAYEKLADRMAG